MPRSFNPERRLICHLCGWHYTEAEEHDYNNCAGRIKQRQIDLQGEMRGLEQKYVEANKRAQQQGGLKWIV